MLLILLLTGTAGFLISFVLLEAGLTRMGLRYPLAILLAYCVFLLLLRLWLYVHEKDHHVNFNDDLSDLNLPFTAVSRKAGTFRFGGGSDFSGGGAGGSWGESVASAGISGDSSLLSNIDLDSDSVKMWLVVIAIAAILGGVIASLYVVFIAPALLSEILVDGVLVAGLYRRMKNVERRYWLIAALKRTWVPLTIVVLMFTVAGYSMEKAVPGAHSIGGVWKSISSHKN